MREKYVCASSKYLLARDYDLLRCERFALDRGVSISCSTRNVTVVLKSDHWNRDVRPLAEADVQFGHFPSGKAAAINSHPAPTLSVGDLLEIYEQIDLSNPSPSDLSLRSTERKTKSPNLDSALESQ